MPTLPECLKQMGERVRPGQRVADALTAERVNAMMAAIRALARGDNVFSGPGILKATGPNGVVLRSTAVGRPGQEGTEPLPFDVTIEGTTMSVRPGTINGLMPSNNLDEVTISLSSTYYLHLDCTANNGQIVTAELSAPTIQPGAVAPTLGQPPTSLKVLLAVIHEGTAFRIWGNGNVHAAPEESFRIDRAAPAAGELPYEIYYTWRFEVV